MRGARRQSATAAVSAASASSWLRGLEQDVAAARVRLDAVGEHEARASEDGVEGGERVRPLHLLGLQRGDIEVALDRLARARVGGDQLAKPGDRGGDVALLVLEGGDVEQGQRRVLRLAELGDELAVGRDGLLVPAAWASAAWWNRSAEATAVSSASRPGAAGWPGCG